MLTTSANGEEGCAKSASECVGCAVCWTPGEGGRAEFPEMKDRRGRGPKTEEVTWVASGLRKISLSKYLLVSGGSCWMFLLPTRQLSGCDGKEGRE
jgi:hypothetical protein